MTSSISNSFALISIIVTLSASYAVRPSMAQDLSGIKIGSDRQALRLLGSEPVATQTMGPHSVLKYVLAGGNEFSATFERSSGKIVYLETDWGGQTGGAYADWPGMKFGQTTLSEIRKLLGNNGFAYKQRPGVAPEPDGGLALFNSYQIRDSDTVVTFVTRVSPESIADLKKKYQTKAADHIAENARLHSVILASNEYTDTMWGAEKVYDPGYAPIQWGKQQSLQKKAINKLPVFSQYKVTEVYRGPVRLPDFEGRDQGFKSFRTRLRDGMKLGADFAGDFHVIQFGCGTGCSAVLIGNVKTGEVAKFPRGGESAMYLNLKYKVDSSLMIAQWASYDEDACYVEFLNFTAGDWKALTKWKVGDQNRCMSEIDENLRSAQ